MLKAMDEVLRWGRCWRKLSTVDGLQEPFDFNQLIQFYTMQANPLQLIQVYLIKNMKGSGGN